MKIGLALGGGGAKGFFHIGILKALERLGIKIDYIGGTSVGALVGALYALYKDAGYVERRALQILEKFEKEIFNLKNFSASSEVEEKKIFLEKTFNFVKELYLWNLRMIKPYLVNPLPFVEIFKELFGRKTFKDCSIPFVCSAVDLYTGKASYIRNGLLYKAVLASCSLPGIFPPLKVGDKLYVDGGIVVPLPVEPLKKEVDFVIGVNLDAPWEVPKEVKNALEVMFLVDRIRYKKIVEETLKEVNYILYLKGKGFCWTDFDKAKLFIELGEKEILDNKERLIKILKKFSRGRWFKKLLRRWIWYLK